MDVYNTYMIAEFNDGLQLILLIWYNAEKQSSIWPSHFKTQFRINKAIMTREMPRQVSDWEEFPIKRIFGIADTYSKAMEKLVLAQDTSNIDDTDMSPQELRDRDKKRRRMKAKKKICSSSEEESSEDKENNLTQFKTLPAFPPIDNFVSVVNQQIDKQPLIDTSIYNSGTVLPNKTVINTTRNEDTNRQVIQNYKKGLLTDSSTVNIDKGNVSTDEFRKQVLLKLNKILYKIDTCETKINMLEHKIEFSTSVGTECNITFPIPTMAELTYFEEQLQEIGFQKEVLNIFKLVGGGTAHSMTHNILKKAVTNSVALNFSWAGKRNKKSFKELKLEKFIAQAVRMLHGQITDSEIADSISKWLSQATLRTQREKSDEALE